MPLEEFPDDIAHSEVLAAITDATEQLETPISAERLLAAIRQGVKDYSETTKLPELAERLALNRLHRFIGALAADEVLKDEVLALWQQEVDIQIEKDNGTVKKLPRGTKKAYKKAKKGVPLDNLGQKELARLQALMNQQRRKNEF